MQETQSGDALRATAREAKTEARDLAQQAKSEVKDLAQQAKEQATTQAQQLLDARKGTVIDSISGVARALQSTASQLEQEQQGAFARYASDAAQRLEGFSESLRNKDIDGIRRDAESFARAKPALFLGGCVAIGFALSRFFKASGARSSAPAPVDLESFGSGELGSDASVSGSGAYASDSSQGSYGQQEYATEAGYGSEAGAQDFDAVNAADPGIGVSSEMSFDEPRGEPVTSEWNADKSEQSIQESATGVRNNEEWKP